jgi:FAD/FMN-containing dehydrogenase
MPSRGTEMDRLERAVHGPVIWPEGRGYDEGRRTFNAMIERRPAVIVRPLDVDDVVGSLRWASERDLPVSVRGGGHSVAGHAVGDGALMLDLASLRSVSVDPALRVADAGGGARLDDLDRATTAHGLAAPSGTGTGGRAYDSSRNAATFVARAGRTKMS